MAGRALLMAGIVANLLTAGCSVLGYRGGAEQPDYWRSRPKSWR